MKPMSGNVTAFSTCLAILVALTALAWPRCASAYDPPADPCSLFTAAQIGTILGQPVSAGKRVVASLCEWDAASHAGQTRLTVGFLDANAWERTKALRERIHGIQRTPIAGLGEEAVFAVTPVTDTLQVKKGNAVLDLHLYGFAAQDAKTKAVALARAALGKF
ncbi:MAG: hypothetical protein KGL92_17045 [Gammaproteobacteria bacterium]|nr:hypothetical protein [Gammaproteobacteria bacterium]